MSAVPLLKIRDLSIAYYHGRMGALWNFDLTLDAGDIAAIIGPNGAGKTSAVTAVAGFLGRGSGAITNGTIEINGETINGSKPHSVAKKGVGLVPEQNKVFLELTPLEHFRLTRTKAATSSGRSHDDRQEWVMELFPELKSHVKRVAGYLSGGQRQMLAIATALLREPALLMIDEFSQGLAPIVVNNLAQRLVDINRAGTTLLLVEQNPNLALSLASNITILDGGRVVGAGPSESMKDSPLLQAAYLGLAP
jgi:branched-chain amino acid transport system ATP-binding protein